jgi:hypothetical protein
VLGPGRSVTVTVGSEGAPPADGGAMVGRLRRPTMRLARQQEALSRELAG